MATEAQLSALQRAFDEFNERFEALRSGGLEAYFEEFYVDDAVVEAVDAFPAPGRHVGLEGYRAYFDEAYGPFEDVRFVVESMEPVEDRVLARARVSGCFIGDPTRVEVAVHLLYRMDGERIAEVRVYRNEERARASLTQRG